MEDIFVKHKKSGPIDEKAVDQPEMEVRLRPSGSLQLWNKADTSSVLKSLALAFSRDWREGLFELAGQKTVVDHMPTLQFWQGVAGEFLTDLCHLPAEEEFTPIASPNECQLSEWILKAPPMQGGEYLSQSMLLSIWSQLNEWVGEAAAQTGGIHRLLDARAPKWQQVGRVCLHLAENKKDSKKPFAFMATYSMGFGASGQLKHLPLRRALEQYAGVNNRSALIKLLSPIQKATEKCSWLEKMLTTKEIYQPIAWPAEKAYQFLTSVPALEESGLSVRIPNWWKQRVRPKVDVTIDTKEKSFVGASALLSFDVQVSLGDTSLTVEELQQILHSQEKLVCIRGQWIEVDSERLKQAISHWDRLKKTSKDQSISFIEGMRLLSGVPSDLKREGGDEEQESWVCVKTGKDLEELLRGIRDPKQLPVDAALGNLHATLRPYQNEGVSWLSLISGMGLGACLADDMGLGKTIQILSLLLILQQGDISNADGPSLLVLPASLLGNWKREAKKFAPSLRLLFVHPSETDPKEILQISESPQTHLKGVHLVLTTYSMLVRQQWLSNLSWNLVILDEAQAIKNGSTKQSRSVKKLKARSRIALTGTPIENKLGDLWSLFDFLNPGLLGSANPSKESISKAYRRLALIHHPDKGGKEEVFVKVKAAYDLLTEPGQKTA